ncbi:MAG: ABC transporter permease [Propionivibrio sp.]|uniref:ABC transporter permease n=1 Tax=Candidatus Propionivibrio dominans TaxID=2954373 RepID=A0A9D7IH76_9RHOO|nr:ABC transporter permease [Candidatus Propionivibrio dominans]
MAALGSATFVVGKKARSGALLFYMWQFCLSAWRSGFRSRSVHAILVLGVLLVGVAFLSASFSPRQPKTVALDVGLSGMRFSLVLFALFWVQELVGREVERRTVMYALSYPVSRGSYIIGRYLGILGLLALAALLLGMLLWLTTLSIGGEDYEQGFRLGLGWPFWITVFGVWVDAALVAAFALWIASLSTVPMLPVALGVAFAVAGKSLGAVIDYLARGADNDPDFVSRFNPLIESVQWVLPDMSRLDWRVWPMYELFPGFPAIGLGLLMAAGYAVVMLALAVITFSRREFS